MLVIHHNDLDGRCSAALLKCYLNGFNEKYIEMDYNKDFPYDEIQKDETVYILDFSAPDFNRILEKTPHVIWIDHHKTAIEKNKEIELKYGLRQEGVAACVLTWLFLFSNETDPKSFLETKTYPSTIPIGVALIGDYDVWNFYLGETTWNFHFGMMAEDDSVESPIWEYILKDDREVIDNIIRNGKLIKTVKEKDYKEEMLSKAFRSELQGYKTICCNTGRGSYRFDSLKGGYDIMSPFFWDGSNWGVSLYTENNNIDVSKIAKSFGGGGHKGAAGFICKELPYKYLGKP